MTLKEYFYLLLIPLQLLNTSQIYIIVLALTQELSNTRNVGYLFSPKLNFRTHLFSTFMFFVFQWLIIMTSAVNAISPGDYATEWMPIRLRSARHWVLQVFGGIIIITGFLIILSNKIINEKAHFVSLHAKFGLASFIFMLITMLGGVGALYSLQLKYYLAPIYTKLLHATVGLITFILGIITIVLGLFSNWWSFGEVLRYTGFGLVLAIMLCTILRPSLKIYFRVKERLENTN